MRKGIPVRGRLPTVKHENINGMDFARLPIFQMFFSSFRLWIMDPEHVNSIALKNACLQRCREAR